MVHRPEHDLTAETVFAALSTRPDLLPRLLEVEGVNPTLRAYAEKRVRLAAKAAGPRPATGSA